VPRKTGTTTTGKATEWDSLFPLLEAMHHEFQELSKKKLDGPVGSTKVKMVNRLLTSVYKILDGEINAMYLDLLNEDDLPQNSDVVLVLGQAVAAMKAFRAKYYGWRGVEETWLT
jgi:hypothetical protein